MDELVEAYWEYYRLSTSTERAGRLAANFDAWEAVQEVIEDVGASESVDLIVRLIKAAPAPEAIGYVGAGPLEDLLQEHADDESMIEALVVAARRERGVRLALGSMYWPTVLTPETRARLELLSERPPGAP